MGIDVVVPTVFLTYTDGNKHLTASGTTVGEVLVDVDDRHPGLRSRVVATDGGLRRFINIYVNDVDIRHSGVMETRVSDGDSIMILPAVAGG